MTFLPASMVRCRAFPGFKMLTFRISGIIVWLLLINLNEHKVLGWQWHDALQESWPKCRLQLNHAFSSLFTGLCTLPDPYLFHDQPPHPANTLSSVSTTHNWWDCNSTYILGSLSHIYSPLLPFLHGRGQISLEMSLSPLLLLSFL